MLVLGFDDASNRCINGKGVGHLKSFFEEFGMVLVVTIIATGLIVFSNEFKDILRTTPVGKWNGMAEVRK